MIRSLNPTTGELLKRFEPDSPQVVEAKLARANEVFHRTLRTPTPYPQRAAWMNRAAGILEAEKWEFARLMTLEMGKPVRAAVQEVEKCALACRFYAENAERFLADTPVGAGEGRRVWTRFQPLGPVLAIMPWNFPFWQVFRFAAPALMAGNVGVLKHASNVPQCGQAIESVLLRAGFPEGSFTNLLVEARDVEAVIKDPRVMAVTLTGSVEAGRRVAAAAGAVLKKTVLELGGSDPFIVMPSADLDAAVETAVRARILNNGQSCISAKRFIIDSRVAEEFQARFVGRMASVKVGDPMDEAIELGPLATESVREDLHAQVSESVRKGAHLLLGGQGLEGPGFFYAPTVLSNIPEGCPAHRQELFGPVASLFRCNGIEDALRIANDSEFGLGAAAWTGDGAERDYFIQHIEAGLAFVNGLVASDPKAPFGGIKSSGYGRELGVFGIREFVNIKTVSTTDEG